MPGLRMVLEPQPLTLLLRLQLPLGIYLFIIVPKGFFPQQDTGRLMGGYGLAGYLFPGHDSQDDRVRNIVMKDPAIEPGQVS